MSNGLKNMPKMKTFLILLVWIVTVNAVNEEVAKQIRAKSLSEVQACGQEVSASSSDIDDIIAHRIPSTREGKCVYFCLYKLYNAVNDDGSLNIVGSLESIERLKNMDVDLHTKISTAFKDCQSTPPDVDPCTFASNLAECIIKKKKEFGISDIGVE